MASFVARYYSFCLLVAFFCFSVNVNAREGKLFFSKFTHLGANSDVGPNPKPTHVSPAPAPAPGPVQVGGRTGDGHFGPGSGMIPQTKESWPVPSSSSSTTTDEEFDKLMEKFDQDKGYGKTDRSEVENYDLDKLSEEFDEEESSDDSEDTNGQKGEYRYNSNNNNGYTYSTTAMSYKSNHYNENARGYGGERQGMSDTRFMENGKYYYGVDPNPENGENTPNRYENARENYHTNEYETMEEYYKSLEGSEESMP
ncbi:PREDICTED: protein E6 [Tarenaya hassleriana]|uniref:protein E6 n=1 Tax=Tarenaya hassleriana TaxID=28532 RepID=UPI00053C996D|nr:PREDICTED: protein E6 [Tarenaya hassleriana]